MKFSYDAEADALRCYWGEPGQVAESDEVAEDVILDYDANGRVIGVEILDAKKRIEYLSPECAAALLEPSQAQVA